MSKRHGPGFEKIVDSVRPKINETNVDAVKKRMDKGESFFFVDVREESEWAAGHLPNAMHIGKGVIERDIETKIPDKSADIVLYCGGGYRSALAAFNLQLMGYRKVTSMDGGYRGWVDKKLPTVR